MGSKAQAQQKWEGKTSVELKNSPAQVWPFLADFCNVQKIIPGCETCHQIDGVPRQPGLIRYCAGTATDNDESTVKWAKEKLIAIDPIKRCFSYEVLENNMGLKSYVATLQVIPVKNNDEGCIIEYSFVSDPIEGSRLEDYLSRYESILQKMAKKIGDVASATASA